MNTTQWLGVFILIAAIPALVWMFGTKAGRKYKPVDAPDKRYTVEQLAERLVVAWTQVYSSSSRAGDALNDKVVADAERQGIPLIRVYDRANEIWAGNR